MVEFFNEREKVRKAQQAWLNKFQYSFERALKDIDKHHERRILTFQTVSLAIVGAFIINLLTSVVYDLSISIVSPITAQRAHMDIIVGLTSLLCLMIIFGLLFNQLQKYKPPKPFLYLLIKPQDIEPFLEAADFQQIMDYLEKGSLKDFKAFGDYFFQSLHDWFSHLFSDKVSQKPVKEHEELETPLYTKLPTMTKEYDISAMSPAGVKITLKVVLAPNITYSWTQIGDKTAAYSFYLIFRFSILNPEHSDANRFLEAYYHLSASHVVEVSSFCLASAFRKIGCVTTPKPPQKSVKKVP